MPYFIAVNFACGVGNILGISTYTKNENMLREMLFDIKVLHRRGAATQVAEMPIDVTLPEWLAGTEKAT